MLAWHHAHGCYQSGAKPQRGHQQERECCLACADGLLGDAFAPLNVLVFDKLDAMVRASSLGEMVHALMRPSLKSCQGQIPPETFNLIMFSHNHRRDKSGKRQGKAPRELLTGQPLEAPGWALLLQQITTEQGVTSGALLARPPLPLGMHNDGETEQQAMAPGQAIVDLTDASANHCRQKDSAAA